MDSERRRRVGRVGATCRTPGLSCDGLADQQRRVARGRNGRGDGWGKARSVRDPSSIVMVLSSSREPSLHVGERRRFKSGKGFDESRGKVRKLEQHTASGRGRQRGIRE